jgi:predicted GNAT family N-acyltransferase
MASITPSFDATRSITSPLHHARQETQERKRIRIREASYPADRIALEAVRSAVFVREQNVPRHLEFDGWDSSALHWLALIPEDEPVGTLRLLPSGQLGRLAVLGAYRGRGVGSRLVRHAIGAAEVLGWDKVGVNAQHTRRGFYAPHGFIVISDVFTDAGTLHQRMLRPLNQMACGLRHAS